MRFSWTSYVEKSGSGTGEIIDKCRDHGLATPIYDPTEGFFKTIIWRNGYGPADKRAQVEGHSRMAQSKGTVRGPSQGPESGARVKSPSQKGPEKAQKRAQKVLCQGTKSVPSQGGESRGHSRRAQSKGTVEGHSQGEVKMRSVLLLLKKGALGRKAIAEVIRIPNKSGYLNRMLQALLDDGLIARTIPDKPNSRLQMYRLTVKGRRLIAGKAFGR